MIAGSLPPIRKTFVAPGLLDPLMRGSGKAHSLQNKADLAWAFEDAIVDTLLKKCARALKQTGLQRLVIAGGVGANKTLRQRMSTYAAEHNMQVFYPRTEFCTDNGAMIAYAGYARFIRGCKDQDWAISVQARSPLGS